MKNNLPLTVVLFSILIFSTCKKDKNDDNNNDNNTTPTTVTDIDGNVYHTVTIGTQTWMCENLRTTKYNDNTAIPNITDDAEWDFVTTGAYCNYNNNDSTDTIVTFGRLYNWYAVNTGRLAPAGWHVPSDYEWNTLITYLGGDSIAGGKLKETGTTHWMSPNTGATNEYNFTALPGGYRDKSGPYDLIGSWGYWWSATEDYDHYAFARIMFYDERRVDRFHPDEQLGFSVRCIKD